MNDIKRREIFARLQADNPTPTTELVYNSVFELLIAVILSAQATDKSVNKATAPLFAIANTPEALYKLGEEKLKTYIKSIGLYNSKAKNIILSCKMLIEKYDSCVPDDRKSLESLAGVGRKTANVILNTAFGQPTMAVDTHIFRVSNRIGLATGNTVRKVEDELIRTLPEQYKLDAHHWLILHGRYTCIARQPKCRQCLIADLCEYKEKII